MNATIRRTSWLAAGLLWATVSGGPAMADDTELFIGNAAQSSGARPNILFIIDTSGSMDTEVTTQATYNPATTYSGSCNASRVYWREGPGEPPSCNTDRWFNLSALKCNAASQAFQAGTGFYTDTMAQYGSFFFWNYWTRFSTSEKSANVECEDDRGVHGDGVDMGKLYAGSGYNNPAWTSSQSQEVNWGSYPTDRTYTLFSGNYVNWYNGSTSTSTRIQVVKDVANSLLNSVNGVNVGLMRFNDSQGGPVIHAMENIATARPGMISQINSLNANGWTPLSETLYEAGLYYRGANVLYGNVLPTTSVVASRTPGNLVQYKTPITTPCQRNYIVLLTDGEPTQDTDANNRVPSLPGYSTVVGGSSCDGSGDGKCLDDMAEYLFKGDQNTSLTGKQNVVTYTIGFTVDLPLLASTAARGGGDYFTANDTATLSTALTSIVTSILESQTTFTAPAVSVNSFNRTRNLNDLFISVFKAAGDAHWPGNLKKYSLRPDDGEILDANGNAAVNSATGFFADSALSYWSASADGPDVEKGGAASRLPAPAARKVYTYLTSVGNSSLTASANSVTKTNALIDNSVLAIGQSGDPGRDALIDFIRGIDVTDADQDNNTSEQRNQMGDPLHAQPVSVIYSSSEALVYFATNDGFLHAIDSTTGIERWTFIPQEFLADQKYLYTNNATPNKHYGIDGNLRVQTKLTNDDGVISGGDKVYLYFGMRRGGTFYYGLDITNPNAPTLLWRRDNNSLPGLGQSWGSPVPARINVQGTQNSDKLALVISGGYDASQDNVGGSKDTSGNSIYIVDSVTGALLWHGSKDGRDADFNRMNAAMDYSIPADIKVVDLDGDGYADRMYAADMGGQIWKFDIFNGSSAANLVTGGVIAQLGGAPSASPVDTQNRRFYYSPDVAQVSTDSESFIHIGIGSGYRAHPNSTINRDRFYALRDYAPFTKLTQSQYNAITPTVDADLVDVTDNINAVVPSGGKGWRFELRDGGWLGEKVLSEARTFNNQVFFTTFRPSSGASANNCEPQLGVNRLYVMSLFNGAPVTNLDDSVDEENLEETDRYREFTGSISSEVTFIFPSADDPQNCVGDQCTPEPVACVDLFCFPTGFANDPIRTFWSEKNVD